MHVKEPDTKPGMLITTTASLTARGNHLNVPEKVINTELLKVFSVKKGKTWRKQGRDTLLLALHLSAQSATRCSVEIANSLCFGTFIWNNCELKRIPLLCLRN